MAREIANRLTGIFLRDKSGRQPVYGGTEKFQTDPHWKNYILFFEYFRGDNGAGLGASHQTDWTGVVAKLIEFFGRLEGTQLLDSGKAGAFAKKEPGAGQAGRVVDSGLRPRGNEARRPSPKGNKKCKQQVTVISYGPSG